MNILANIKSTFQNNGKIKWVSIDKIVIDPELKGIFKQDENEIIHIAEDMKLHGYNPSNPITLSEDYINVDGNTRYLAAKRAGLTKVAVVFKHFDSRKEMLDYAYRQQLHRRNLSDKDIFEAYIRLRSLNGSDGKKAKTDSQIAEELQTSLRQVSKMKEVEKKASSEIIEDLKEGKISLNKAYVQMKQEEKTSDTEEPEVAIESVEEISSENTNQKSKAKKPLVKKTNKEFSKGFISGWSYVLDSLKYGKNTDDLISLLSDFTNEKITIEELQKNLMELKEVHEQKQTEQSYIPAV